MGIETVSVMPRSTFLTIGLPPLLALTSLVPSASLAQQASASKSNDSISYSFKRGDTLYDLGHKYLERASDWRTVQRDNHIRNPRTIPPGKLLIIPAHLLKSEPLSARIIGFKGAGQVENGSDSAQLALDMVIQPGNIIETGPDSFATMELSNGSRITLPSQTRLRIKAMRRFLLTDSVDFDFTVERGRIETTASPLGRGKGRYRIRTPIAVSAVRGTTFRIGYEGIDAPSLTEVVEGLVAVSAPMSKAETAVEKGFGVSVAKSGAITKESLLPAPALIEPGKVQVDPVVSFTLQPLEGARSYHAQVAKDAGFVELLAEQYSGTPKLDFADIPNGRWFVRTSAIAPSGLEGLPQTYTVKRVLTALDASAGLTDDGYLFRWSGRGAGKRIYHFRLRRDAAQSLPLVDEPGLIGDSLTLSDLPPGKYLWHIGVAQYDNGEETTNWMPEQRLTVTQEEPVSNSGPDASKSGASSGTGQ